MVSVEPAAAPAPPPSPTAATASALRGRPAAGSQAPPTAVQRVHTRVREAVLSGEFADGLMLSEGQIATELGVSRTPVREAFVQLESQGFLRLYPKRGALIVPVTRDEVQAILETRWAVERHALELAAKRLEPPTLEAMQAVVDDQAAALTAGELGVFSDLDREFHRVAVAATGNAILIPLYDSLRDRQRRLVRDLLGGDAVRAQSVLEEHRALLDAVRAGKANRAVNLLREHLDGTQQVLAPR